MSSTTNSTSRIQVKRVYEPADSTDGARILVERLWPRGMTKADLRLDAWIKEVAPSQSLRTWYKHDPAKWPEFRRRYIAELDRSRTWQMLLDLTRRGRLTLLFSARDEERNSAVVLRDYLRKKLTARPAAS